MSVSWEGIARKISLFGVISAGIGAIIFFLKSPTMWSQIFLSLFIIVIALAVWDLNRT